MSKAVKAKYADAAALLNTLAELGSHQRVARHQCHFEMINSLDEARSKLQSSPMTAFRWLCVTDEKPAFQEALRRITAAKPAQVMTMPEFTTSIGRAVVS